MGEMSILRCRIWEFDLGPRRLGKVGRHELDWAQVEGGLWLAVPVVVAVVGVGGGGTSVVNGSS